MTKTPVTIASLAKQIETLEAQHAQLREALTTLLPLAMTIPATTADSASALQHWAQALKQAEATKPRSEDFWHLASAMSLVLSSRAVAQHPTNPEVVAIFQGLREHRRQ